MHPAGTLSAGSLNSRQRLLLAAMQERGQLLASQAVEAVGRGVTDRTVRKDLSDLIDAGYVQKHGRARAIFYTLARTQLGLLFPDSSGFGHGELQALE